MYHSSTTSATRAKYRVRIDKGVHYVLKFCFLFDINIKNYDDDDDN